MSWWIGAALIFVAGGLSSFWDIDLWKWLILLILVIAGERLMQ
jgi:hypothetical protein